MSVVHMTRQAEHILIRKAKAGDPHAFEALIRAHQDSLYAFVLRLSGRTDIAEDIVQEAFVRVLRNLDRFDSRFRFSTWLFTIAKRLYVNAMQKLKPTYDSDAIGRRESIGPAPGNETTRGEMMHTVRGLVDHALTGLTPQQREIILLFHQQEWGITQIAEHLDMPEGTVKSHLHRARKRMKRSIMASPEMQMQVEEVWL